VPEHRFIPSAVRALVAAALVVVPVGAIVLLGVAPAAASTSVTVSGLPVHAGSTVVISGAKDAESTVSVSVRPPGAVWTPIDGSCVGIGTGSTAWSCQVPADAAMGEHKVRVTDSLGGSAESGFQVVPAAAQSHKATTPPPPPPTPTPTPTATPTPTPTPTPTGSPSATPTPKTTVVPPAVKPKKPADVPQLPTLALPVDAPITGPADDPATITPPHKAPHTPAAPDRNNPSTSSALGSGLPVLSDILQDPVSYAAAGGFGALLLLLIAIPAHLFDDTIEANSHRISAWFRRFTPAVAKLHALLSRIPRFPLSGPLVIVLASVAFGFSDPSFGFDLVSLRTTLALAIGLVLVMEVPNLITSAVMARRWSTRAHLVVQPGALVLSVLGVLASRIVGFHPGLLIGLVMGLELAAGARAEVQKRAITTRMIATAAIATGAWLLYSLLTATTPEDAGFATQLTRESLVAATDEGLTGLVVALIPINFLEGRELFNGSKRRWAAIAAPVAFLFAVLVLPRAFTEEGPQTAAWVWIVVLVGFCVLAFSVGLGFHLTGRKGRAEADAESAEEAEAEAPAQVRA
jgi:hypothetical protein